MGARKRVIEEAAYEPKIAPGAHLSPSRYLSLFLYVCAMQSMLFLLLPALLLTLISTWKGRREQGTEREREGKGRQESATQLAKQMQIKWRDTKQAATCK